MTKPFFYISTTRILGKAVYNCLIQNYAHFSILISCVLPNWPDVKKIVITSRKHCKIQYIQERLYNDTVSSTELFDGNMNDQVGFIGQFCSSYSFKRLWNIEIKLRNMLKGQYCLEHSLFIHAHLTSNIIHIYKPRRPDMPKKNYQIAIIMLPSGFGDVFRHAFIFQEFIRTQTRNGYDITMIHSSRSSYLLSDILFTDCDNQMLSSEYDMADFQKQGYSKYSKLFNLFDINYLAESRASDIAVFLNQPFDETTYDTSVDFSKTPHQPLADLRKIHKRYTYVVGVQFNTFHDYSAYNRSYPLSEARRFVRLCQEHCIAIVNLTFGYELGATYSLEKIPMVSLPGLVRELDMVVGIDSFGGHLACMLNLPTLILYNSVYAFTLSVLRRNYNLVSANHNFNSISAEIVFERMYQILKGAIPLSNLIKKQYNILKDENTSII